MRRLTRSFLYGYISHIIVSFISIIMILIIFSVGTYIYFARDLITKESIINHKDSGIILLDRFDRPFFAFYQAKYKSFVPLSEIPKQTQQALIASEDKEFYYHPGFSLRGIIRSLFLNLRGSNLAYGGSTITQQLVKNSLLQPTKSFMRKYQEIVLAYEVERRYTKDQILEMYLNSIYFGSGAFGIEGAAQIYFGKNAKDLTLAESTTLISFLPSPSQRSPANSSLTEVKLRQKQVLENLAQEKYITQNEMKKALKEPLQFYPQPDIVNSHAPHFALMVRDELIKRFGEEKIVRSGFKVRTTLNLEWQKFAEQTVSNQVAQLAGNNAHNGATVVIDPKTGEVKALVGSKDWYNDEFGKVNIAERSRQPGSAFKPIVYSAALERHIITPATILHDQPTTFGINYRPKNYDGKFRGNVTVRRALSNSLNVPSVEVLSKLGVESAIEMAQRLGLSTIQDPSQYGLSLVLGAGEVKLLELTSAYSVFANNGYKNPPTTILKIEDRLENTIYSYNPKPSQVLEPEVAFLISSILSDNNARTEVFGNTLTISRPAAVKTGTTENYKDAWTVGYTPSLTIGVWVGNNDGAMMDSVAGSLGAAPIWKTLMEKFLADRLVESFEPPQNIIAINNCVSLPRGSSIGSQEYFIKGTESISACHFVRLLNTPTPSLQPSTSPSSSPSPTIIIQPLKNVNLELKKNSRGNNSRGKN